MKPNEMTENEGTKTKTAVLTGLKGLPKFKSPYVPLEREKTNLFFSQNNQEFIRACEAAGVKPTPRQASKYKSKKGLAYTLGRG